MTGQGKQSLEAQGLHSLALKNVLIKSYFSLKKNQKDSDDF